MKKIFLALTLLISINSIPAQGIEFFHGTLEEAKEIAKRENKLIFIDCYTTWCGPCKMLSKFVFTDPEMGEFYNENFINLATREKYIFAYLKKDLKRLNPLTTNWLKYLKM